MDGSINGSGGWFIWLVHWLVDLEDFIDNEEITMDKLQAIAYLVFAITFTILIIYVTVEAVRYSNKKIDDCFKKLDDWMEKKGWVDKDEKMPKDAETALNFAAHMFVLWLCWDFIVPEIRGLFGEIRAFWNVFGSVLGR